MQANMSFKTTEPSGNVVAFLDRIEQADPNSPDISEDDNNACWGHQQFTASTLTCTTVLISWQKIGNTDMACRLIAAAIKTCKVARHLCSSRNIDVNSYLSDIYLSNIVELLWKSWKDAGGVDVSVRPCTLVDWLTTY
jgi:hypothetical protein